MATANGRRVRVWCMADDPRLDVARRLAEEWITQGFTELPLSSEHAEASLALPPIHRDPIDRLLVAQALVEGLTLATDDETLRRYPAPVL